MRFAPQASFHLLLDGATARLTSLALARMIGGRAMAGRA
jgi:hypothetical protein